MARLLLCDGHDGMCLQRVLGRLPEGCLTDDPHQLGAMLFSCAGISHDDAALLANLMPTLPLQVWELCCPVPESPASNVTASGLAFLPEEAGWLASSVSKPAFDSGKCPSVV